MVNLILFLISFLTITTYLIVIYFLFGILPSISDSYYKLKNKAIFSLVLMFTAFPLIILSSTGLMFFAGSALIFVASAPAFMSNKLVRDVHVYSAYSVVLLSILSIIIDYQMWYLALPLVMLSLATSFKIITISNRVYWLELIALEQIFLTLYINKIL